MSKNKSQNQMNFGNTKADMFAGSVADFSVTPAKKTAEDKSAEVDVQIATEEQSISQKKTSDKPSVKEEIDRTSTAQKSIVNMEIIAPPKKSIRNISKNFKITPLAEKNIKRKAEELEISEAEIIIQFLENLY